MQKPWRILLVIGFTATVLPATSGVAQLAPLTLPESYILQPGSSVSFTGGALTNRGFSSITLSDLVNNTGPTGGYTWSNDYVQSSPNSILTGDAQIVYTNGNVMDGGLWASNSFTATLLGFSNNIVVPNSTAFSDSLQIQSWRAMILISYLNPPLGEEIPIYLSCEGTGVTYVHGSPGNYTIDSSDFDVSAEISLDDNNWIPAGGPFEIIGVPEPSSWILLGLGGWGLVARSRRGRR
jgi:hypothetical protein